MTQLLFKAFSALLSYPTAEMRQALPEIADVIRGSALVAPRERTALLALVEEIGSDDLLSAQEHYVDLFDRGRALSLHLFEHLHGESRDRGSAMVELKQLYAAAGFELTARELPDYLPVVLEYLSCRDMAEAGEMLADCADILRTIARALIARRSRYAAVLQALIVIAGEKPVDAAAVPPVRERHEALDRDWLEQPAFADPMGRR
ncbi:nitrate reductase molybdenum cofactor assembly chaperone [Enhydrobacter sp.]|jgi:nitrate reductase delta subunit|uniref:nitrate reductase molybdenum cofactor assembly chaperone n=1 Tax=Enhydrobacter sp. TaxID=1894999 RepID=UPI0026069C25|nr:nitrate reductase molybdenum cofactor assembly chaperone [Enhydrobacter sp.]WIM13875.1 MAG: Respiratory nitrate reductase delta chain [Enhydrobacter sp.]